MIIIQSRPVTMLIEAASEKEQQAILSEDPQISEIHRRHVVYTEFVVKSIMLCTFLAGLAYVVGDLYLANEFYKLHPNAAPTDPKPHSIYFWFPFNPDEYYKIALTYEFVHIVQTVIYNGASHAVVNSAIIFVKVELKILEYEIRHMMSKPNLSNLTPAQLMKIHIRKHQELINWVCKFNDSFKYIILLEYSVVSLTLASTLTEILQGIKMVFNGIFFLLSTLSLFILSWNANEIIVTSVFDLSDALYHFPWYELDKEAQELVLFMMLRCKRSLNISNGPFGFLTLRGAVSRLKLAYSVVSVLSR
ncbi:uncharacterized protein LOC125502348 [Dendroctonus ponderosae]|uniref:uncharacterized protein LOC125502348 n=1 Tax=Dendroctonus ponderosae TaxID=77166 RepID=UPI00203619E1|nr:uncharacterized protein LOC125502348 [Dendroctonus ponderosae]